MSRMNGNQYHGLLNNHQFAQGQMGGYSPQQIQQMQMQQMQMQQMQQHQGGNNVGMALQNLASRQAKLEGSYDNIIRRLVQVEQRVVGGQVTGMNMNQPSNNEQVGQSSFSYGQSEEDEFREAGGAGNFGFNSQQTNKGESEQTPPEFNEKKAEEIIMDSKFNLLRVSNDIFHEDNKVNITQLKLDSSTLSVQRGEDLITEGLSSIDLSVYGKEENEQTAVMFHSTNLNRSYRVALSLIKKELLVPAESLPMIMKRLMSTIKDAEVLMYLHALDRVLTQKLNDFYSVNVGDLGINSYAMELDSLNNILRTQHPDIAEKHIVGFNKIANFTVRETFESYIESMKEDASEIDLVTDALVLHVDRYSLMMGIDKSKLSYDKFVPFEDLSLDVNGFAFIVNKLISENSQESSMIVISREGDMYKFMQSLVGNLYVKRFASFI